MSIQYHQIFPQSFKSSYLQNDVVDMVMTFENQSMVAGSIQITGKLVINKAGTPIDYTNTDDVKFDSMVGIHSAFQAITCLTETGGVLENNNEYPRYVKCKAQVGFSNSQVGVESNLANELRTGDENSTITKALAINNGNDRGISFSFQPDVAFNKSNAHIPFNKSGVMKLTLRLATNNQFLFGANMDSTYSYEIQDLQLHYRTIPQTSVKQLQFNSVESINNTVESNNASLATRVPAMVQSVSCVFIREANANQDVPNNLSLEIPPDVERVEFSFNDSTTQYISFVLEDREEIIYNYQRSWGEKMKNNMTLELLDHSGRSYGIGLPFNQFVDMSNQKFGLNLKSSISNQDKYKIFMFFRSVKQL
ncbi:MAG: hypothetical protein P1U85_21200 [Verrucomicrobiales bacterium]|nr:hypothetical protein [Verrucomicrobiales bacterium]